MTPRHRLFLVAGFAAAIPVTVFLTLLLVPDSVLQDLVARLAQQQGYSFRAQHFGKAFPVGLDGTGLVLANDKGDLLKIDKASVRLELIPLLAGTVTLECRAAIGAGSIRGEYSPRTRGLRLDANGIMLEDIPFFRNAADARVKGLLRVNGSFSGEGKEPEGELRLEIKGANISGVKMGGIPLPDADYSLIQGMIRKKGASMTLESFTLQGEGLYVRLKGDFPLVAPPGDTPLNLTLELMPKPEFLDKQKFIFLALIKYLVTPGNYRIPIGGTLAQPLLQ